MTDSARGAALGALLAALAGAGPAAADPALGAPTVTRFWLAGPDAPAPSGSSPSATAPGPASGTPAARPRSGAWP